MNEETGAKVLVENLNTNHVPKSHRHPLEHEMFQFFEFAVLLWDLLKPLAVLGKTD
jgi:hypothetical protein